MPNDFPALTPREINLITENNRLRRGLLIAERQLILVLKTGKPPHRCAEVIQEIREALSGLKNGGLGPEDVLLEQISGPATIHRSIPSISTARSD